MIPILTRRAILALPIAGGVLSLFRRSAMAAVGDIIDDLSAPHPRAASGAEWEFIADRVMGGVSEGSMGREIVSGRPALRMQGDVSLENNGGFLQLALDLAPDGSTVDASGWTGIEIDALGNGERYNLHLRTADVTRPWQSYRQSFMASPDWRTHRLSFAAFEPHRIDAPLDVGALRRIGVVAIGRVFFADVAIGGVRFYA
jgi:hypothetical protein